MSTSDTGLRIVSWLFHNESIDSSLCNETADLLFQELKRHFKQKTLTRVLYIGTSRKSLDAILTDPTLSRIEYDIHVDGCPRVYHSILKHLNSNTEIVYVFNSNPTRKRIIENILCRRLTMQYIQGFTCI